MKEGFEALARGEVGKGRFIFAGLAAAGNPYAQLLLARARYHGYYGMQMNQERAHELMYTTAKGGYAPAAAECLRRMQLDVADFDEFTTCVLASHNLYANGVLEILAGVATGGLDDPRVRRGEDLIVRAAFENPPYTGESELAAVEATWSITLQERAAIWGFADAQLECHEYAAAAAHYYTPALLLIPGRPDYFARGVMQRLLEENDTLGVTCEEEWKTRWEESSAQQRYILSKLAYRWTLPFYEACYHYSRERTQRVKTVCTYMWTLRHATYLGHDLIRLLGQHLWRRLDGDLD